MLFFVRSPESTQRVIRDFLTSSAKGCSGINFFKYDGAPDKVNFFG
jgi:hypothetical protein